MIDLFFSTPPQYKRFSSEASIKREQDLLDMAMSMLDAPKPQSTFPKYNVYRELDKNPYVYFMEFALAGYPKESLDVKMDSGYLIVSSKTNSDKKEDREYTHRGMARRDFSTRFYAGKDVEVRGARFADGLLTVELEQLVPEEQRPKSISIT